MNYLVVGLGNPGTEYANTRHNIGFIAADAFARSLNTTFSSGRYASVAKGSLKGRSITLIKPSTFMNLSGKAVRYWMKKCSLVPAEILVVVDDVALPPGALRLRKRGSDGGHNGLISIVEMLGTTDFPRLRVGIGNDYAGGTRVDYVLSRWTREEEEILTPRIETAVELIRCFVLEGIDKAMNRYNN
jgi:PTH1 family peptidyl-tRNA hydrolase